MSTDLSTEHDDENRQYAPGYQIRTVGQNAVDMYKDTRHYFGTPR